MPTKKVVLVGITLVLLLSLAIACIPTGPRTPVPTPAPTATPNLPILLDGSTGLKIETTYIVTLKFKKHATFDPFANALENEWKAEHREIVVGQKTYDGYSIGQELSNKFDTAGLFLDGEFASYIVSVEKKESHDAYYVVKGTISQKIRQDEYAATLAKLESTTADKFYSVPFDGVQYTYILDKPLSEYKFASRQPLTRYFITVEVKNETLTLDLSKMIRNATNTHEIDMEVSAEQYTSTSEMWEPKLSTGSLIISGHWSTLHGRVIKKWTEVDQNYVIGTTDKGVQMIIPK